MITNETSYVKKSGIMEIKTAQQRIAQITQQIFSRNSLETNCSSIVSGFQLKWILPTGGGK